MTGTRVKKGGGPWGLVLGPIVLVLLLNGLRCSAAPRPGPVHVYGGYSSISKSVTVTKRLEYHMNNDQALDDESLAEDNDGVGNYSRDGSVINDESSRIDTNNRERVTTNSSAGGPQVNHSVQYSIETKSNVDGNLLPPMTVESVNNDLNVMQKMAEDNMKKTENMSSSGHQTSTTNLELQNSDGALQDDSVNEAKSDLKSNQSRPDYNQEDRNHDHSVIERRDELLLEPQFDFLERDVNEPFISTFFEDQEMPSTVTKEITTAIPEKKLIHQTTTPVPSTDHVDNEHIIDSNLNVDGTYEEILGKDPVIADPTEATTEMASLSAIDTNGWSTFFEDGSVFPATVSTEYPTTPEDINKKFNIPDQGTEESTILETVPNAGELQFESITVVMPDVDESASNAHVEHQLRYPDPSVPIAKSTKVNSDDVLEEDHIITTTEEVSAFIEPEEYAERNEELNLNTEIPEFTETMFATEIFAATTPLSLIPDSFKESRTEGSEVDRPSADKIIIGHSDTIFGQNETSSEFEKAELPETTTIFESFTSKDEIGQIQFASSPQDDDIIVNHDYTDYNSDYVSGINDDPPTSDFDYAPFGMGESIEIGGNFPTESAYVQDTRKQSFTPAAGEALPERETFFGNVQAPPVEGNTEPSLDLSSILSGIDFSKIDFSKLDLSSMDLSGVDLSSLDFSQLPSNLNLENFDMSKLPANLDLSTLNLSSLPENLNISGLDLSDLNVAEFASNLDPEKLNLSNLPFNLRGEAQRLPSSLEFANTKDSKVSDINDPYYDQIDIADFQPSNQPSRFHTNRVPPFLLPNFNFDDSSVNQHFDSSRAPPPVPPPQFRFRPSQSSNFRPPSGNFRPLSPGVFDIQQSSNFPPSDSPQFFLVDNFGNGEFVDPTAINIQDQSRYPQDTGPDPNVFNVPHHLRRPDFNIPQQSRLKDSSLLTIRQQQRVPPFQSSDHVQFVPQLQYSEQDSVSVRPNRIPNLDLANLDLGKIAGNLNLGEQDFSKLDLSQLPSNLDLSGVDFSSIPSNFSLGGLDISKIAGNLDLGSIDLSKINFEALDISNILRQLSPGGSPPPPPLLPPPPPPPQSTPRNTRQGFAIRDFDKDVNTFDDVSTKVNGSVEVLVRPEALPGSEQWVTEAEADQHLVDELGISHLVKMARALSFDGSGNVDFLLCTMCKTGVVTGKKLMNDLAKTDREIKSLVIYICIQFELFPGDVCRGMINIVGDEILHVLRTSAHQPESFCGMMLNNQCDDAPLPSWSLELPALEGPKPDPVTPPASGDLRILHISDLHLDAEYVAGTDADCGFPLCCRDWQRRRDGDIDLLANKTKSSMDMIAMKVMADADDPNMDAKVELLSPFKFPKTAGKWGAFGRCDLPLRTVDNILQAGADLRPDIVYVTGDLPAHDVWQQTRESVQQSIAVTSERVRAAFPDTPVVMTVGNHEIVPINSFPVPDVYGLGYNPSWLYESLALQWRDWVPSSSMDTLRKGGYYSVTPRKGLRVLSVNGNYCNSMNWWLMLAHRDPTSQLEWLDHQLSEAEAAGEKVHILSHIPPGNPDCEQSWSRQFARIVARHAATVTGVFSGHQHLDQWQVIFDPDDNSRAVGVTYIAPSATTFREHSPSFRIFTVDGGRPEATWTIVDHATFTTNLTEANKPGNSPHYGQRYTAREAFDMADLSPSSWADVVSRMAVNQTMFNDHMRFKHNYWAEPSEIKDCDLACKTRSLCFLLTGDSSNEQSCERLKPSITIE